MKITKTSCDLSSCLLCKNSVAGWLPLIDANRQMLSFKKKEVIFSEGSLVAGVYFVYKGTVKIHKAWSPQKELILSFARKGDMIGYRALGNDQILPITATALDDVTLCFVALPFFELSLQSSHPLTYALMRFYANALQEAEKRMRNLALMDVKGRVAETLLMLHHKFGADEMGQIAMNLTRQVMAAYAGTTYETFFRMLNELKAEGLIQQTDESLILLDAEKLATLTHTDP
ncbi:MULTISPECIES: Crp/Fnr family transcriptional regulator [unclassified Spirosoma]|uniref:Crp/Fnr family transcriptional regulator n=1 Tax=unclassified Spirosoma TaxID=2621999 RepID=UPI000967D081|nr:MULTISPECIES: Crp/Fnr family transcriptional regulator [unclassified Spirosoma]OJW77833.1 MAG: transcriptional regulator [Spirosoma sp. 48-14]